MRVIFQIALLILYITASNSSIYNNVKGSLSDYFKKSLRNIKNSFKQESTTAQPKHDVRYNENAIDGETSKRPKAIIRIFKAASNEKRYPKYGKGLRGRKNAIASNKHPKTDRTKEERYRMDPVLNNIKQKQIQRRAYTDSTETSDSSSSSLEMKNWKNEWKEHWVNKKIEALEATQEQGDVVNMVAARPWGVPCGDPGQHDMPWGTCMLPMQCEAEYRIYRGDFLCGRSKFVCCAIQLTNYDLYQGFDVSFADSALTTDSEEKRNRGKGSKEKRRRRKKREKRRRRKAREKRKKKIKKNIKKIIKQMRKILKRQYRNGTSQRKKKTKQLKKFIKDLKKKYRNDRKTVKDIHEIEMVKVDVALMEKLNQIKSMNQNFVKNVTFRDIVVNGTMSKKGARMLVEAYPELVPYFHDGTRRSGNLDSAKDLDYDVEYGMLYY